VVIVLILYYHTSGSRPLLDIYRRTEEPKCTVPKMWNRALTKRERHFQKRYSSNQPSMSFIRRKPS